MGRLLNSCKEQQQIIISWFSLSPYNNTVHRARHSSRQQGDKFILGSTYPPIGDNSPAFKNFILPKQTGLTCGGSSTGPSPSDLIVMQWVKLSLKCKCNGKFNLKDYATNCNLQVAKHGEIVRLKSEEQGEGVPLWTERWRWTPDQFNIELSALQYFGILRSWQSRFTSTKVGGRDVYGKLLWRWRWKYYDENWRGCQWWISQQVQQLHCPELEHQQQQEKGPGYLVSRYFEPAKCSGS